MGIEDALEFVEFVRYQVPDAKNRQRPLSLVLMSENIVLFFFLLIVCTGVVVYLVVLP